MNIDFAGWKKSPVSKNAFGRTILIDGFNHSIEFEGLPDGTGRYLLQIGKYDGQHGRFDGHLQSGLADNLEDAYKKAIEAVMGYALNRHEIDLSGWTISPNSTVEAYGRTIELGDRDYVLEIRRLSDSKAEWSIHQGDEYDGERHFDAHILDGKTASLQLAYDAINEAVATFQPPAPRII
ncbi:hypothetical protein L3V16_20890 [Brucella ciceri]|uniref:hypothetical protein n=1 Tax=Brucella ciceri TaxID=391287 RepID=UPI001F13CF8C|nr:hypothetical protein [Brucella ciceri]MCH6206283.1 hypothetical protein [Brucella ciceri]